MLFKYQSPEQQQPVSRKSRRKHSSFQKYASQLDQVKRRDYRFGLKYQTISEEVKERFIQEVNNQVGTIKSAADKYNINLSTAKSILSTYRKEGRISKKIRKPNLVNIGYVANKEEQPTFKSRKGVQTQIENNQEEMIQNQQFRIGKEIQQKVENRGSSQEIQLSKELEKEILKVDDKKQPQPQPQPTFQPIPMPMPREQLFQRVQQQPLSFYPMFQQHADLNGQGFMMQQMGFNGQQMFLPNQQLYLQNPQYYQMPQLCYYPGFSPYISYQNPQFLGIQQPLMNPSLGQLNAKTKDADP